MNAAQIDASALFTEPPEPNPDAIAAARLAPTPAGSPAGSSSVDQDTPQPASTGPADPGADLEIQTGAARTDRGGTPFDPARHLDKTHPKTGRWMPRRQPRDGNGADPGADAGSVLGTDEASTGPAAEVVATATPATPAADVQTVMADLHCRAFYGLAVAFLSDEWLPKKGQHEANCATLAAYYRAKGMTPDSPGWALVAQLVAYAGERLAMPKTQTRLGTFRAWIASKWFAWRGGRRSAALQSVA